MEERTAVTPEAAEQAHELAVRLAMVQRKIYLPNLDKRRENDAEHTLGVLFLADYYMHQLGLDLDRERVYRYAMVHDSPEIYESEDFHAFVDEEEKAQKETLEAAAVERMRQDFPGLAYLLDDLEAYRRMEDDEALFVWTVDKMQALITAYKDKWLPNYDGPGPEPRTIGYEEMWAKYSDIIEQGSPLLRGAFQELVDKFRPTYWDQPKTQS